MIQLGVATVHLQYRKVDEPELRRLAVMLFEYAEGEVRQRLRVEHTSVVMEVEEGTLKIRTKIIAGAIAVGTFLGNYGSIREGAVALGKDVYTVGKFLVEHIPERVGADPGDLISTHRSATLTRRIEKIVHDVERGQLDADEAVDRLVRLLEVDQNVAGEPKLVESLKRDVARMAQTNGPIAKKSTPFKQVSTLATEEHISWQEEPEVPRVPAPEALNRPRRIRVEREPGIAGSLRIVEE